MKVATKFVLEPMRVEHIPAVHAIEKASFPQAWPRSAYRREIEDNSLAYYIVAKQVGRVPDDAEARGAPSAGSEGILDRLSRLWRPPSDAASTGTDAELASIVGYAGLWATGDEAHVTTIASHPDVRGRGVGDLLLLGMIYRALAMDARWVTLEVRVTNILAQNLYKKYTFREMGVRRRYYTDNGEDALVMWTDALDSQTFLDALDANERHLSDRMGAELCLDGVKREISDR